MYENFSSAKAKVKTRKRTFLNLSASQLNGAGESAMDLEEFEATKTTLLTDEDEDDEADSALDAGCPVGSVLRFGGVQQDFQ